MNKVRIKRRAFENGQCEAEAALDRIVDAGMDFELAMDCVPEAEYEDCERDFVDEMSAEFHRGWNSTTTTEHERELIKALLDDFWARRERGLTLETSERSVDWIDDVATDLTKKLGG